MELEYAYKKTTGFMGKNYVYEPSSAGTGSYVVMPKDEYDQLKHNYAAVELQLSSEKQNHAEDVDKAKQEAEKQVSEAYEIATQKLEEYKKIVDAKSARLVNEVREDKSRMEKDLEQQMSLNKHLKRIARERANRDRKIKPKKEHDGYLVLESIQWTEYYKYQFTNDEFKNLSKAIQRRYPDGYYEKRSASVWRSVLQTPYDASLPIEQIRDQVEDTDLWYSGILDSIGCVSMSKNENNGKYSRSFYDTGDEKNHLYRWDFKANFKSGFWELVIYTTKSLCVPPERRPYLNRDKDEKK